MERTRQSTPRGLLGKQNCCLVTIIAHRNKVLYITVVNPGAQIDLRSRRIHRGGTADSKGGVQVDRRSSLSLPETEVLVESREVGDREGQNFFRAGRSHFKFAVPAIAVCSRYHDRLQFGLSAHFVGDCANLPLAVGGSWMGRLVHLRCAPGRGYGGSRSGLLGHHRGEHFLCHALLF